MELLEDNTNEFKDIALKGFRKNTQPGEKISLGKSVYNIMIINKYLLGALLEGIDKYKEEINNKFAEGHSASDARIEADLQSLALLKKVD